MLDIIDTKSHTFGGLILNLLWQYRSLVHRTFLALSSLTMLMAGCVPSANQDLSSGNLNGPITKTTDNAKLRVVATNAVLADLASNVGGGMVSLTSLVPAGGRCPYLSDHSQPQHNNRRSRPDHIQRGWPRRFSNPNIDQRPSIWQRPHRSIERPRTVPGLFGGICSLRC